MTNSIDPKQLEAFAAVMSTGSITGAARLLARSQPAVTRLIQEFEAEIGQPLFLRNGPRVTPTEQGFLLREDVDRALSGLRQVRERAGQIARREPAPLALVATSALALGLVPQALKRLESRHGPGPVSLRSAAPEQVLHAVLQGAAPLGLSSLPLEHRGLCVHWIGQLPCLAVLPEDDPLATLPALPPAALHSRRLITMSNPYRLRHRLEQSLGAAHPALIETNSSVNALSLVRAGLGLAVLEPLSARSLPLPGLVLRPLEQPIPFFFGAITRSDRSPATAPEERLQALVQALLESAQALPDFVLHAPTDHARLLGAEQAT